MISLTYITSCGLSVACRQIYFPMPHADTFTFHYGKELVILFDRSGVAQKYRVASWYSYVAQELIQGCWRSILE